MILKSVFSFCIAGFVLFLAGQTALGQGTAFSYQGQLSSGGSPANGDYRFIFTLYNNATNGTVIGSVTNFNVAVNNGLFMTTMDFGPGIFTGSNYWLQIAVSTNTQLNFTVLQPLQPVLPVPYAIFATSASNLLGQLPAVQLSGTLPPTAFAGYTNTVALTNGANLFAGSFYGNGGAITNVNATNLVGILSDAQLPGNTAFVNSNQTFSGVNTFNNLGNSFSGSFFGNGLVGWIVVPGTAVTASSDHGYLLTNSQLVTVTLPSSANVDDIVRIAGAGATGWKLAQLTGQSVIGNFLNFGTTWYPSDASDANWTSMASSSDGTRMVASAYAVGISTSTDSGRNWINSNPNAYAWTGVASSADGTKLAAVASANAIFTSTNAGSSWQAQLAVPTMYGIASSANGNCLVAGAYASDIVISTNGGIGSASWFDGENSGGTANIVQDWMAFASSASGSQMYAACSPGYIFYSSNSGHNWTQSGSVSANWVSIACSADGTKLIAAYTNSGSGIFISTNSATSWTQITGLPAVADWASVASSADGSKLVAAANGGAIYSSTDWGNTWQTNNIKTAHWSCLASSSDGSTLAAGIDNTLTTSGLYGIYYAGAMTQSASTVGTGGHITGGQGSSVELQYIGNNQWMPVSSCGTIWAQ